MPAARVWLMVLHLCQMYRQALWDATTIANRAIHRMSYQADQVGTRWNSQMTHFGMVRIVKVSAAAMEEILRGSVCTYLTGQQVISRCVFVGRRPPTAKTRQLACLRYILAIKLETDSFSLSQKLNYHN